MLLEEERRICTAVTMRNRSHHFLLSQVLFLSLCPGLFTIVFLLDCSQFLSRRLQSRKPRKDKLVRDNTAHGKKVYVRDIAGELRPRVLIL